MNRTDSSADLAGSRPAVPDPDRDALQARMTNERRFFDHTLVRKADLEVNGSGSLLNDELFGIFQDRCRQFGVHPDPRILAGLLPSVRSALGFSSERLLGLYAQAAIGAGSVCLRRGRLFDYRIGSDFAEAVKRLRAHYAAAGKLAGPHGSVEKARRRLQVLREEPYRRECAAERSR